MKSGLKRTINWNRYQSKITIQVTNPYLDYLIDSNYQVVNRLFAFSFDQTMSRTRYRRYFLDCRKKDYNVMIDEQNYCPVKNVLRTYDDIRKIATSQGDDYKTDCLLG